MNEQDFSIMDETVAKICNSLITEPEKWTFGIFDIVSPSSLGTLVIVNGLQDTFTSVRHSRRSVLNERVFSYEQGQKIRNAYYQALSITGSKKQQKIIKQLSSTTLEKPTSTEKPAQLALKTTSCKLPWILFSASVFYIILRGKGLL